MIINYLKVFQKYLTSNLSREVFSNESFSPRCVMDENRIIHRFRPRPYDLRRKVLLKNFLREQMTYIPPLRETSETSTEVEGDSNFSGNPTTSIGNQENFEIPTNDPSTGQSALTKQKTEPMPSSSASVNEERCSQDTLSDDTVVTEDTEPIPKFSLISTLLKLKTSRKRRKKGISKAKHVYKNVKSPNKSSLTHRVQNKPQISTDKPAKDRKSFFSLFKSRKEKRNKVLNAKKFDSSSTTSTPVDSVQTTSQSVQTDISWSNSKYNELERSHKCLQEENRLLSESLSLFMDFKTSPQMETSVCTDSYCSNEPKTPKQETPRSDNQSSFHRETSEKIAQRSKLLRSKSVQEKCSSSRIRLRSRSMNFPGTSKMTSDYSPGHSSSAEGNSNHPRLPTNYSNISRPLLPQRNRPSVLKSLPINSSRTIVRRSSMPERTSGEPVRPLLRPRSNSIRAYNHSSETYRYPNSAPLSSNRPSALKNLPINKPIMRRSSMPERMPRNHFRSVYRHHSVNDRDYYNGPNKYNYRTRYVGDSNRSVPFRDLPNEAFY